ncbi:MAG: M55 family metallopeptidase [Lentisphaerae bacterium]|nr:M55 family metallopeptidase [Lentisphaerota bacterium]
MKIYILTDLEGVTGVYKFEQTREKGAANHEAVKMMMTDIAAVAEGLKKGGATEIYALDGHGGGHNFLPELMVSGVRYIVGRAASGELLAGLDSSFDGMVLLGYHAMNGTPDGLLHHTQSSVGEMKFFYNGIERGEIYQMSVIAGHFDVPVILVTADVAGCREARATLGDNLPTVAVKKGLGRESAILLSQEDTYKKLSESAEKAMITLPNLKPFKETYPINLRITQKGSGSDENPYFSKREVVINNALEIVGL